MDKLSEGLLDVVSRMGEATQHIEEFIKPVMDLSSTVDAVRGAFEKAWPAIEAGARLGGLSYIESTPAGALYEVVSELYGAYANFLDDKNWGHQPGQPTEPLVNAMTDGGDPGRNHFKPQFTSLEKMGFIMSGSKVQNPYDQRKIDLLQQIADNTKLDRRLLSVPMSDNKHLYDIIDPPPYISNLV